MTTLAIFIAALDSNIVTLALPKIGSEFAADYSLVGWIVTGNLLALAALTLQAGKLGDLYGRKKIFLVGFSLFGLASALSGTSSNVLELIVFRVVGGLATGLLFAVSRPLILSTVPAADVGFALGVNSAAYSAGAVAGPLLGGFLVAANWRLVFFVNVPFSIIGAAVLLRSFPRERRVNPANGSGSINLVSSVLLAACIACILVALSFFRAEFAALGLILALPLLWSERRSSAPLVDRELRSSRGFIYAIAGISTLSVGYGGLGLAVSFFFQSVAGLPPEITGIIVAPQSIALAVTSLLSGRAYSRAGNPMLLAIVGAMVTGAALVGLAAGIGLDWGVFGAVALLILAGAGTGLYWTPLLATTLRFGRRELTGAANGTFSTFVTVGMAAGVGLTVAVSALFLPASLATQLYGGGQVHLGPAYAALFRQGLQSAILVLGAANFLSIPVLALVAREERRGAKPAQRLAS